MASSDAHTRTELASAHVAVLLVALQLPLSSFNLNLLRLDLLLPLFTLRLAHASDKVTVYHPDKSPLKFGCPVDKSTVHSQPLNTEFIEPTHRDETPVAVVQF